MQDDSLAVIADQLQSAWERGRICSLVGRGCHARIIRISRLVDAGCLLPDRAMSLARETEAAAFCFSPLPSEPRR